MARAVRGAGGRHADSPALAFEGERLTYRELDGKANALARRLRELGVAPEVRVALWAERSADLVTGLLAILKAGGAYVPIDPGFPRDRVAVLLAEAGAPVLLTQASLAASLPEPGVAVALLEDDLSGYRPGLPWRGGERPEPGLCPVHLGLDGEAEGCGRGAPATGRLRPGRDRAPRHRSRAGASRWSPPSRPTWGIRPFPGADHGRVPARGLVVAAVDAERPGRALRPRGDRLPEDRSVPPGSPPLGGGPGAGSAAPPPGARRRKIDLGAARRGPAPGSRLPRGQSLRTDRVHGRRPGAADRGFGDGDRRRAPGPPVAQCRSLRPERAAVSRCPRASQGSCTSAAPGWRAATWAGRTDGRAFRARTRSAPRRERGSTARATASLALPDGDAGVPRPRRPPGQDARLPHRARRDRGRARAATRRCARRWSSRARTVRAASRLVAYVVAADGASPPSGELRGFLREQLPEYMVPSVFVLLAALPLTPNGKVDRARAAGARAATPARRRAYVAPRNARRGAAGRDLGRGARLERVGIHDNFFELGGDSILSIQVVARAPAGGPAPHAAAALRAPDDRRAGARWQAAAARRLAEQGPVTGAVPLTPIQHWFFEQDAARARTTSTRPLLLEAREPLDAGAAASRRSRHLAGAPRRPAPALRAGDGRLAADDAAPGRRLGSLRPVDLSASPGAERGAALEARRWRSSRPASTSAAGPLLRGGLLPTWAAAGSGCCSPSTTWWWTASPGASCSRIWSTAYRQLARGRAAGPAAEDDLVPALGRAARRRMPRSAGSAGGAARTGCGVRAEPVAPLPRRPHRRRQHRGLRARAVTVALDARARPRPLLQEVPRGLPHPDQRRAAHRAGPRLRRAGPASRGCWSTWRGTAARSCSTDVDLSRTVGWFTTLYPVLLERGTGGDPGEAIQAVKEQLRRVPGPGHRLRPAAALPGGEGGERSRRAVTAGAEVKLQLSRAARPGIAGAAAFSPACEPAGPPQSPRARREHLLAVGAQVLGGRLRIDWSYSESRHRRETVEEPGAGLCVRSAGSDRALPRPCGGSLHSGGLPARRPPPGRARPVLAGLGSELPVIPRNRRASRTSIPLTPCRRGCSSIPSTLRARRSTSSSSARCSTGIWTPPPSAAPGSAWWTAIGCCARHSSGRGSIRRSRSSAGGSSSPGPPGLARSRRWPSSGAAGGDPAGPTAGGASIRPGAAVAPVADPAGRVSLSVHLGAIIIC